MMRDYYPAAQSAQKTNQKKADEENRTSDD